VDNFQAFLVKKCFEISYALGRLAASCASFDFSRHLQKDSLELIEKAHFFDCGEVVKILGSVGHKLKIGLEMGLISDQNFQILNGEIDRLTKLIEEHINDAKRNDVIDLGGIFSKEKLEMAVSEQKSAESTNDFFPSRVVVNDEHNIKGDAIKLSQGVRFDIDSLLPAKKNDIDDSSLSVIGGEMRQSAILGKIRQSGYCRLKDIQEIIPESSERTLRYDLQKLIDKGSVERVGSGGPASFYRMRRSSGSK
jgi:hypothetical protein